MCLTIKRKFNTKEAAKKALPSLVHIAKRNITVYKKLKCYGGRYESPFLHFQYEKGTHYYQVGKKFTFDYEMYGMCSILISHGLHAYRKKPRVSMHMDRTIVKMVIPKGSKYYIGIYNDIVSDNLIWY